MNTYVHQYDAYSVDTFFKNKEYEQILEDILKETLTSKYKGDLVAIPQQSLGWLWSQSSFGYSFLSVAVPSQPPSLA